MVRRYIADVEAEIPNVARRAKILPEGAGPVEIRVAAHHLVPARLEMRNGDGTNIAEMTGHQDAHAALPTSFAASFAVLGRRSSQMRQGASPPDQRFSSRTLSRRVSMHCQKPKCLKAISCPSAARFCSGCFSNCVASPSM